MKKTLSSLLALVLTFLVCFGLISCDNTNNPSNDNPTASTPGGDNPNTNKPFNVDLAGYVANIGNATALGISKKAKSSGSTRASYGTNHSGIKLLSYNTLASDKDTEDKNYIVMSTTDYDSNAPEADKTGLTKVTFTKIVTENVTTETTGTKYIIANEGTISISATEGFKYTVYYNDSLIYNEVQDNDSNDKDAKIGVIVLDNLIDGMEYKVNYKGIGVETTITQDEINGEIDKLCVMNGYTFISFVPIGTSQRPANTPNIEKDVNGYIAYDKENYYSNNLRQSFVIDNDTGYVYPIKDVTIQKLHNNLLFINNLVYDYNIIDDNLSFFPLFTNETIEVKNCMKDKYGNNYVINDKIASFDYTTKTTYILHNNAQTYCLTDSNEVVFFELGSNSLSDSILRKYDSNRALINISLDDNFNIGAIVYYGSEWIFTRVNDGFAYMHEISDDAMGGTEFIRYNIQTDVIEHSSLGIYDSYGGWTTNTLNSVWVDDNHVIFYTDLLEDKGQLFCAQIWNNSGKNSKEIHIYDKNSLVEFINRTDETKPVLLLDGCVEENWNNHSYADWRLSVSSLTGTNYYKIVFENGKVCVVNEENYVAPAPQNYTLYPLNK